MCLGSGARNANEQAIRTYEYQMKVRKRKHLNKMAKYGQLKNQYDQNLTNIYQGYRRAISEGQVKLNRLRQTAISNNQEALMQVLQKGKGGLALAAGRTGRSIDRFTQLDYAALGRYQAGQAKKLTEAGEDFMSAVKAGRRKVKAAQNQQFASVAFNPQADIAPPRPVMQNVGWAMFTDALSIAGSIGSLGSLGDDNKWKWMWS